MFWSFFKLKLNLQEKRSSHHAGLGEGSTFWQSVGRRSPQRHLHQEQQVPPTALGLIFQFVKNKKTEQVFHEISAHNKHSHISIIMIFDVASSICQQILMFKCFQDFSFKN